MEQGTHVSVDSTRFCYHVLENSGTTTVSSLITQYDTRTSTPSSSCTFKQYKYFYLHMRQNSGIWSTTMPIDVSYYDLLHAG